MVPAWPEGVTDGAPLAPGMPVTVAAGQEMAGIDVYLAKMLKVREPAAGGGDQRNPDAALGGLPERPASIE